MTPFQSAAIAAAGVCAGIANAVVGSGTLLTFPTLLATGFSPVVANVSNTTGLVLGSLSSILAYRTELAGQRVRVTRLGMASLAGAALGAVLLLVLPASAFRSIVPMFIGLGVLAVLVGPQVSRTLAHWNRLPTSTSGGPFTIISVFVTGTYGGYFGAGQGLLFIAVLGVAFADTLHRLNALRNVLTGLANLMAAVVFIAVAHVAWEAAGLLASGSVVGGWLGVNVGRRLPPAIYRGIIAAVGVITLVRLSI